MPKRKVATKTGAKGSGSLKLSAKGSVKRRAKKPAAGRKTKQQVLLELLQRTEGATIEQAAKALDWQPHSVRGFLSGVVKKRLGLTITSEKGNGGRVYRVASAGKQS